MSDVNIRRLFRRSTTYLPPLGDDGQRDDGVDRGLDFIALGARAMDTVGLLQSEWVSSGNSMGLGTEKDPVVGQQADDTCSTVPDSPPRRVTGIQSFNTLRGGEHLFMPSLTALRWIAALP